MPVSTQGAGSGSRLPSGWRSNCMNTRFQISMKRSPSSSRTRRAAGDVRAVVVEDLGARAAGTGVGHLPEVVRGVRRALVVADADDALGRQADVAMPDVEGFVVGLVDGDQQALGGQLPDLRQQFPRPGDGVLLEVVGIG